jgi:CTP:molybdopterin cytidylyltransferase MocA
MRRFRELVIASRALADVAIYYNHPLSLREAERRGNPLVLSKMVDGVVLVLSAGVSTKDQVKRARQQLQTVQAKILGVVLNNIDTAKDSYYYNYQYYHYYAEDKSKSKRHRRKSGV